MFPSKIPSTVSKEMERISIIDSAVILMEVDSAFYYNKIAGNKSEQFVPGFNWKEALRPKSRKGLLEE